MRKSTGFDAKQAETLTAVLRDAAAPLDPSTLATKADLVGLATKAELAAGLATLKADLLQWIIGLVAGAVVVNAFIVIGSMLGMAKLLGH